MTRLQISRKQIDKCLKETEEFNDRINDPAKWQAKLRVRQEKEKDRMKA